MNLTIDTDEMKDFPNEDVLIWCPRTTAKGLLKCSLMDSCPLKDFCRDTAIRGRLASVSAIKRWLAKIAEVKE